MSFTALPSGGFDGEAPPFPLEPIQLFAEYWEGEGKERSKAKEYDEAQTESFREREQQVWEEAWRTPQAEAWNIQSWRWPIIGEYCRLKVVVELDPSASAALVGQLHRYRDQIGLTPAGLRENGWAIAVDEVSQQRSKAPAASTGDAKPARRLRAVDAG